MDRGAWQVTVPGAIKGWSQLSMDVISMIMIIIDTVIKPLLCTQENAARRRWGPHLNVSPDYGKVIADHSDCSSGLSPTACKI